MNDPDKDLAAVKYEDHWLTDELQQEILSHYPQSNEIYGKISRDAEASFRSMGGLFSSCHKFASYVQVWEAMEMFLKAWGASSSHGLSHITCFYGKASKQLQPSRLFLRSNVFEALSSKNGNVHSRLSILFRIRRGA
jgi:hypothetical protein